MLGIGYAGMPMPIEKQEDSEDEETACEAKPEDAPEDNNPMTSPLREAETAERANGEKTLKDAVKVKNRKPRRKSRSSSGPS